jgi:hypothetical protein
MRRWRGMIGVSGNNKSVWVIHLDLGCSKLICKTFFQHMWSSFAIISRCCFLVFIASCEVLVFVKCLEFRVFIHGARTTLDHPFINKKKKSSIDHLTCKLWYCNASIMLCQFSTLGFAYPCPKCFILLKLLPFLKPNLNIMLWNMSSEKCEINVFILVAFY